MLVFLNGEIIKEEDAKISIHDLSYQFGYGLFETIKCEEGIPLFFEAHYKRLTHSAREIGMSFPVDLGEVREWILKVLKANSLSSARVKLIISKKIEEKFNVLILAYQLDKLQSSFLLLGKVLSRDTNSVSFRYKTTSRADSYVAYKEAIENGFNDVLYLNEKNELVECTRANIFLSMEDKIITPILESGILSGITREKIIEIARNEGIIIEEKNVHSLFLNKAQGVFTTNAIIGVMPVSKVKTIDKEYNFNLDSKTIKLKNAYDGAVVEYLRTQTNVASSLHLS